MRLLPLLVLCLLSGSCALLSPPFRSSTVEVSGEIYVVTAGRETVPLTGAKVYAFRLADVRSHLLRTASDASPLEQMKGLEPHGDAVADSSGRFSIRVPRGEYAIGAVEHRQVGEKTEYYQWLVPATSSPVTLSNNNLPGEGDSLLRKVP
jgi:hypothetical protein